MAPHRPGTLGLAILHTYGHYVHTGQQSPALLSTLAAADLLPALLTTLQRIPGSLGTHFRGPTSPLLP